MSSLGVAQERTSSSQSSVVEGGLTTREATRRREVGGPNEISMATGPTWRHALARQLLHPLALLLWAAAALSLVIALPQLAVAITVVIVLNAVLALWQERQTGKAIDVLKRYLPQQAHVIRDGEVATIAASDLVIGDLMVLTEGDRVSADGEIVAGAVDVDMSTINGESVPVGRTVAREGVDARVDDSRVFSGTVVLGGDARVVVTATGMATELGRIAALSHRQRNPSSPLERQVRTTAWLIALVAVIAGAAFIPLGTLVAGLSLNDTIVFAIGLLVANVPEGLLPTITLALAMGVRQLARQGTLVRRLSAVETLGSVSAICTDKTGTLTRNNMQVADVWTRAPHRLVTAVAALHSSESKTEPTTKALQYAPALLDLPSAESPVRVAEFRFDPVRRILSVVVVGTTGFTSVVSGAPESVMDRCVGAARESGDADLDDDVRRDALARIADWAQQGLRVIAVAERDLTRVPENRDGGEVALTLVGLVALVDPIRDGVPEAVRLCHEAGIAVHVITGDHPQTAAAVARKVGIGEGSPLQVITGSELDQLPERELDQLLMSGHEIVFARSSPEAKLRVTDALRECGVVSAMTGDGVNDAPALRRADVGVAMGRSGTDVAREAATIVLADDNFGTIVSAVEEGRRAYAAVRKFVVYIFAHATPEVIPLVIYALSGGRIPLPLTVTSTGCTCCPRW
jgi:calcium-translocating P-type ATPase